MVDDKVVAKMPRRSLFTSGFGLSGVALSQLLHHDISVATTKRDSDSFSLQRTTAAKAKHVIFLAMTGGASQIDMFDHKPELGKWSGRPLPASVAGGERFANVNGAASVFPSPFKFSQCGDAGMWHSSLLPHFAKIANHVCLVKTMYSDEINHPSGQLKMLTGFSQSGRPTVGAWLSYGLGSQNDELPTFVVLNSGEGIECGHECAGSGFLSARHAGVLLEGHEEPLLFLNNPHGINSRVRRKSLDTLAQLNQVEYNSSGDTAILDRIGQYEMAFRLQTSLPEVVDVTSEPEHIQNLYGLSGKRSSFAANCLLARRLVERGVRYVQLNHGGWDFHSTLPQRIPEICRQVDQAGSALVLDLAQRGLLEDTIVVWGTEFGRTPITERNQGRDHHKTFCIWIAGGGFKPGFQCGETDDFGFHAVSPRLDFHDLHATLLHQLGLDHTKLTSIHQGREFRLTDVGGVVRSELLN